VISCRFRSLTDRDPQLITVDRRGHHPRAAFFWTAGFFGAAFVAAFVAAFTAAFTGAAFFATAFFAAFAAFTGAFLTGAASTGAALTGAFFTGRRWGGPSTGGRTGRGGLTGRGGFTGRGFRADPVTQRANRHGPAQLFVQIAFGGGGTHRLAVVNRNGQQIAAPFDMGHGLAQRRR